MYLEEIKLSNFRCFPENETTISFDKDMTCLLGNNGSGKTAFLIALKRLFGSTRGERTIVKDDFHIASDESIEVKEQTKLYIEAIFSFPELKGDIEKTQKTCPAFSSLIYADANKEYKLRIRLEAEWLEDEYEEEVSSKIYWVTTPEKIEFGDDSELKTHVAPHDRKRIKLNYIPATRDGKSTLKNEMRSLTKILKDYADIKEETQNEIKEISKKLNSKIQEIESIKTTTDLLGKNWNEAHDNTLKHYQKPTLEATPIKIENLFESISVKLGISEQGDNHDISELSDGQVSLIYFTLSVAIYEIEQKLNNGEMPGFKELDRDIPIFTIFAFEEPENHLSPYYLGRILKLLYSQTKTFKATGIITSHSSSVVRRINKVEQIRYFRQKTIDDNRYSIVKKILLPSPRTETDYKYINQAILTHPELYFSKLVILAEGASEEIVIPQLARKLGFDLDPSFVAFVKLGGRHVNHMWRLLNDLEIPFLTILDLDLGRGGAGAKRISYIIDELEKTESKFAYPNETSKQELQSGNLLFEQLEPYIAELEKKHDVFYSAPLDLDMAMIKAFPEYYDADKANSSERGELISAVLGKKHGINDKIYSDEELKIYRHLFCTKSKVASHYEARDNIINIDSNTIKEKCPKFINRLVKKASLLLEGKAKNG